MTNAGNPCGGRSTIVGTWAEAWAKAGAVTINLRRREIHVDETRLKLNTWQALAAVPILCSSDCVATHEEVERYLLATDGACTRDQARSRRVIATAILAEELQPFGLELDDAGGVLRLVPSAVAPALQGEAA